MTDAERIEKLERQVALLKQALDHTIVLARHGSRTLSASSRKITGTGSWKLENNAAAGERYFWGSSQNGNATNGMSWTGESMVFPVFFQ